MRNLEVPPKYQGIYKVATEGRSRRAAIRCHCLMCVGWQTKEVTRCTAVGCPLYPYRKKGAKLEISIAKRDPKLAPSHAEAS